MQQRRWFGLAALTLTTATVLAACTGSDGDSAEGDPTAAGDLSGSNQTFVLGVSNAVTGSGWRDQMICAVKAEATARGNVSGVVVISKNGGAAEQIEDIQNLISQGVDAIVVNPSDPQALDDVIEEAIAADIVVVAVDQAVTAQGAYVATTDQVAYGREGMQWLVDELGGQGDILYMRGIDGMPADADRDAGVQEVLDDNPDITVKEVYTDWDFVTGGDLAVAELGAADYDGVWTSGIDYTVVDAFATVGKAPMPVVGADTNGFVAQLLAGQPGAAVTNPAAIGGVGASIALDVLEGKDVDQETVLTPEVWDVASARDTLEAVSVPGRDETGSAVITVEPYTHYTAEQLVACA